MGSGSRFQIDRLEGNAVGFGGFFARWPHSVSINIVFLFWDVYIGLGKGYDHE